MMASSKTAIAIKKGLDLPISGAPEQVIEDGPAIGKVAVLGPDSIGLRPTMAVNEGDSVKKGQLLFADKRTPGVRYTSPASGKVIGVHRGAKRALLSVVIEVAGDEEECFEQHTRTAPDQLSRQQVRETLVASGLWAALRTRPYRQSARARERAALDFCNRDGHQSPRGRSPSRTSRAQRRLRSGPDHTEQAHRWAGLCVQGTRC